MHALKQLFIVAGIELFLVTAAPLSKATDQWYVADACRIAAFCEHVGGINCNTRTIQILVQRFIVCSAPILCGAIDDLHLPINSLSLHKLAAYLYDAVLC